MAQARREDDGRYYGDLPCRWCEALLGQKGRRRPRRYCGPWHRTRTYVSNLFVVIAGLF